MQRRLRGVVPDTKDAKYIGEWIDDWSTFISDRQPYADHLRTNPQAEFLVTEKDGSQISKSLDNFADVNKMPSLRHARRRLTPARTPARFSAASRTGRTRGRPAV